MIKTKHQTDDTQNQHR